MGEQPIPALEMFAGDVSWYITLLEVISGQYIEPKPKGINLAAEYRWETDGTTPQVLKDPAGRLSGEDRVTIETFAVAVEAVPAGTLSLDELHWQRPKQLALALLPRMQAVRAEVYSQLGWPMPDRSA